MLNYVGSTVEGGDMGRQGVAGGGGLAGGLLRSSLESRRAFLSHSLAPVCQ